MLGANRLIGATGTRKLLAFYRSPLLIYRNTHFIIQHNQIRLISRPHKGVNYFFGFGNLTSRRI